MRCVEWFVVGFEYIRRDGRGSERVTISNIGGYIVMDT
jgi:hypothetical protein